jgi:hypothetical protein
MLHAGLDLSRNRLDVCLLPSTASWSRSSPCRATSMGSRACAAGLGARRAGAALPSRRTRDLANRLGRPTHPARPPASRAHRLVATQLNDINARGSIVGDVYGLAAKDFSKLQRVYPVL